MSLLVVFATAGDAQEPYVETFSKYSDAGLPVTFESGDFLNNVVGEGELRGIVITSLPAPEQGVLYCGQRELLIGEAVTSEGLNYLSFKPAANKDTSAQFGFIPVFGEQTGKNTVISVASVSGQNHPPVASNAEYETIKNIAVTCQFKGSDADGDDLIYRIEALPKKGDLAVSEENPAAFVYTPYQNKTGTDSFTYVAIDPSGKASEPAKITIKITKNAAKMTYSDMQNNPAHYAALKLAEEGVLIGQRMGENYFFSPEQTVTRGEFVAMALTCLGVDVATPVSKTGFADDSETASWVKPYLSAALKNKIITGVQTADGRMVFRPDNTLTRAEAAVIIANTLNLAKSENSPVFSDLEAVPVWAEQAAINAAANGIISTFSDGSLRPLTEVTRADAAEILWQAVKVMQEQSNQKGLLSRVFA
jgi:hypothetical protein